MFHTAENHVGIQGRHICQINTLAYLCEKYLLLILFGTFWMRLSLQSTQKKVQVPDVSWKQHYCAYGTEGRIGNPIMWVNIQKHLKSSVLKLHVEDAYLQQPPLIFMRTLYLMVRALNGHWMYLMVRAWQCFRLPVPMHCCSEQFLLGLLEVRQDVCNEVGEGVLLPHLEESICKQRLDPEFALIA